MREIILDTETTGLDPASGHRVVEIGAVELVNHVASGKTFHVYINPERSMPPEAQAVHGLSEQFLSDKPRFAEIADEFLNFIGDSPLVIHNASFDTAFLNAELSYLGKDGLDHGRIIDTLMIARRKFPATPVSLDALCKRFAIDISRRTKHGALLDSELLALVYLELIGGRQIGLALQSVAVLPEKIVETTPARPRSEALPERLTQEEMANHQKLIESLGEKALWRKS